MVKAMQRLLSPCGEQDGEHVLSRNVHSLCAVVDKLPTGQALKFGDAEVAASSRARNPPVSESGLEGIAYAVVPHTRPNASISSVPGGSAILEFVTQRPDDVHSEKVKLPLANTIFQTGTPSTMFFSTWAHDVVGNQLKMIENAEASYHVVDLGARKGTPEHTVSALGVPLLPLTLPRSVNGSMGNIIRQFVGPDGKPLKASLELEEAVPRFFSARGQPPQTTTVWALVMPREIHERMRNRTWKLQSMFLDRTEKEAAAKIDLWERLWKSEPPCWNTLVQFALSNGARLHRVLSGGGGWGKKAGLLSLDPVSAVSRGKTEDIIPSSILGDPEDLASTLTPVARDGDAVQFFISPVSTMSAEASRMPRAAQAASSEDFWSLEFGSIPSTIDEAPGQSWQYLDSSSDEISVFQNSFGALSEKGMELTMTTRRPEHDTAVRANTTMIDAPFSRLSIVYVRGHGSKNTASNAVGEPDSVL